jgi:hypothetical protein
MSNQPHIRPAIGGMPLAVRNWPMASTNAASCSVTGKRYSDSEYSGNTETS